MGPGPRPPIGWLDGRRFEWRVARFRRSVDWERIDRRRARRIAASMTPWSRPDRLDEVAPTGLVACLPAHSVVRLDLRAALCRTTVSSARSRCVPLPRVASGRLGRSRVGCDRNQPFRFGCFSQSPEGRVARKLSAVTLPARRIGDSNRQNENHNTRGGGSLSNTSNERTRCSRVAPPACAAACSRVLRLTCCGSPAATAHRIIGEH
jgi:hypothetical protein